MPRLSQLMIRTALLWLLFGYTVGGLLLTHKGVPLAAWLWGLREAHIHALLAGWIAQLACGVAFWILPRLDARGSRGNTWLMWLCYVALNAGVVLGGAHGWFAGAPHTTLQALLPATAGGAYALAGVAFAAHAWARIVPFRTLPRPERADP